VLLRVLATLDPDRREVLVLHDLKGYSAPEIAEILATPLNTVYSRLRRARRRFNDAVAQLCAQEVAR